MKLNLSRELIVVITIVGIAVLAMSLLGPVLPLYLTSIGVNPATLGLIFSTAMLGMVIGESAGGWLADKMGIRAPMLIGTFLCATVVLSLVVTRSTWLIFIVFFLWGLVRAAVFGPGRGYIGATVAISRRATFMAIYATVMAGSRSMGAFASGFIVDWWGYDRLFFVAGGVSVLGGILAMIGLSRFQRHTLSLRPDVANARPAAPLYRHGPFIIQSVIAALYFGALGVLPFLSLMAANVAGLPARQIGIIFTISAVTSAVLMVPMGRLADRSSKKAMMATGLLVTALSLAGISLSRNFLQLAACQMIGSVGGAMYSPAAITLLSENIPAQRQSTAMGIYGGCEDVGVIGGSALGGIVWSALGPPMFLVVGSAAAATGAVLSLTMLGRSRRAHPPP